MSTSYATWIYSATSIAYFLFYIAALVFVLVRRSQCKAAANLAVAGLVLMLGLHMVGAASPIFLSRAIEMDSFIVVNALVNTVLTIGRFFGFSLLLMAVFAGRGPTESDGFASFSPHDAETSDNRYVPPR